MTEIHDRKVPNGSQKQRPGHPPGYVLAVSWRSKFSSQNFIVKEDVRRGDFFVLKRFKRKESVTCFIDGKF